MIGTRSSVAIVLLLFGGLLSLGCRCGSGEPGGAPAHDDVHLSPRDPTPRSEVASTRGNDPVPVRVGGVRGTGRGLPKAGDDLAPDAELLVPDDGEITLDFRGGGRIEIGPGSRAVIGAEGSTSLLVSRGRFRAILPPVDRASRPPLRIATPVATIALFRSGDVVVASSRDGGLWLAQLGGLSDVRTGAQDAQGRARRVRVGAGRAASLGWKADPTIESGPVRVEEATERAEDIRRSRKSHDRSVKQALEDALKELDETLEELERERARGERLKMERRRAVERGQEVPRRRSELVAHSKALFRGVEVLLLRWERVRTVAMLASETGVEEAGSEVKARRKRVLSLLSTGSFR